MKALDWLMTAAERVLAAVAVVMMLGVVVIVGLQVVDRHFVDVPIVAPDAYARIFVVWIAFVGYALAVRADLAIRVDLIDHWLSERSRLVLAAIFDLLMFGMTVLLATKGWLLVELGADQAILGTDLSYAVPNAALWVACIAILIFLAGRSIQRFASLVR